MYRNRFIRGTSLAFGVLSAAIVAQPAMAQEEREVDEVVVTGSLTRAVKLDALPVQIVNEEELQKRGEPSVLEIIKQLPAVGGVLGESNRLAGQNAGAITVNLRGLGPDKTLVLMNGRRMPTTALISGSTDAGVIPMAAIGRVEVLTDGGSATYGSDAIAGVANFITKKTLNGLEAAADYTFIDGSDGDYQASLAWGRAGDWGNLLLAAGYRHRSELGQDQRDWAVYAYDGAAQAGSYPNNGIINPQNGYATSGSPGAYIVPASFTLAGFTVGTASTAGQSVLDPACGTFAGFVRGTGNSARCIYHNGPWNNLVDDQDAYQAYGELNVMLPGDHGFHLETLWSNTNVPHDVQQPSYAPSNFPLSTAIGGNNPVPGPAGQNGIRGYYIPADNPGLTTLLALNPTAFTPTQITRIQTYGLLTNSVAGAWRPYGYGGNPLTGDTFRSKRENNAFRISGGFNGPVTDAINYDVALTYGQYIFDRYTMEMSVENLQWALRGLGGFGCTPGGSNPSTSTPGQGPCLWFNPFSTGVQSNAQTGAVNPQYAAAVALNPQAANSLEVAQYLQPYGYDFQDTNRIFVADALFNGELPFKLFTDSNIAWGMGLQYMWTHDTKEVPEETDAASAPCPMTGVTNCPTPTGPLTFFGALPDEDVESERFAVFGELVLPVTDDLEVQLAVRHEDLGDIGTTTNPKASLRWQMFDNLAFRASAGSSFKAPYPTSLTGLVTSGFVVSQLGQFKATDNYGNPDLQPEKSKNYNAGFMFTGGGLTATLDYYLIELEGVIETDSAANLVTAFFGPTSSSPNHCTANTADPYWDLQQRFTFTGGVGDPATCSIQNLQRIRLSSDNKVDADVEGLDLVVDYRFPAFGADLRLGAAINYLLRFESTDSLTEGILITEGGDDAGTANRLGLPRWKGNFYAEYSRGRHNLRATLNYTHGLIDDRAAVFPPGTTNLFGHVGDPWVPVDVVYRAELPMQTSLTLGVMNVFDRDPPGFRQDFGYNTYTANPLGRVYKIGLRKQF